MIDDDRTERQRAADAALEAAVTEILSAYREDGSPVILSGFVLQVAGKSITDLESAEATSSYGWHTLDAQPVFVTLGLADMLRRNVGNWYDSGVTIADDPTF